MDGWIKLHRKFTSWKWYNKSEMVHLFIHLLLTANTEDKMWHGVEIKRGDVVTGRHTLSHETGLSERTIRTCIERLKTTSELSVKTTNKFSIITICNYESYQNKKEKTTSKSTSKSTTTKEDKNILSDNPDFVSLHTRLKTEYMDWYRQFTGVDYYWMGKDGKALNQLIKQLKLRASAKKLSETDDTYFSIFKSFLKYLIETEDKSLTWIKDKATMTMLNSQFQVIIASGHKHK